ncbi:tol protein [Apiospora phragmitis]|uniref:Tol protein n=1 Tax=Apiospora phragmitis TaxID=2905665 RepID=A0ABR1VFB9_9PEZI
MEYSLSPGSTQKRGTIEDEGGPPARRRLLLEAPASSGLAFCDRCREIQWEGMAAIPPASKTGRKAAELLLLISYRKDWTASTCGPGVGGSSDVRGLRVIDCHTGVEPVEAPLKCQYVALSYVWWKPSSPTLQGENGSSTKAGAIMPRVIIDAIAVTKALGERYLWVDKVVAAAGDGDSYGLPGVGERQRCPQESLSVTEKFDIIRIFPHTSAELDDSTWARRGWTYQEGYLSPRRLIFTDHQVSFLCNGAHHAETIQKPKELSRAELIESKSSFVNIIPSATLRSSGRGRSGGSELGKQCDDLKREQLVNYTRRQLTNECDSLNAILGLFRALQPSGIRHLHGVPLRKVRKAECSWLEFPLAWHHEAEGSRRRRPFPSWSWSGWEGGIRMDESDICVPDGCEIGLVERDDHVVPLRDWFKHDLRNSDLSSANVSCLSRVTFLTIQIQCVRKTWTELNRNLSQMSRLAGMRFTDVVHAVLPIREGVMQMAYAYMDGDISLDDGLLGLVLRPSRSSRKNAILLLKDDGQQQQHYQRIGLVRVSGFAKTRPSAVGNSDPQTVYVDGNGPPLDEVEQVEELPLWLEKAVERTITIS